MGGQWPKYPNDRLAADNRLAVRVLTSNHEIYNAGTVLRNCLRDPCMGYVSRVGRGEDVVAVLYDAKHDPAGKHPFAAGVCSTSELKTYSEKNNDEIIPGTWRTIEESCSRKARRSGALEKIFAIASCALADWDPPAADCHFEDDAEESSCMNCGDVLEGEEQLESELCWHCENSDEWD